RYGRWSPRSVASSRQSISLALWPVTARSSPKHSPNTRLAEQSANYEVQVRRRVTVRCRCVRPSRQRRERGRPRATEEPASLPEPLPLPLGAAVPALLGGASQLDD